MGDAFDRMQGRDSAKGDAFDRFPVDQESTLKSTARTLSQVPQGILEATPPGVLGGLWSLLGAGESDLDIEEEQRLKDIGKRVGQPFDEEAYQQARQEALGILPTVSNIARGVESKTGIPLEPKTRVQKGVRFASLGAKVAKPNPTAPHGYTFRGANTTLPRVATGAGLEGVREGLIETGIPEPFADILSFASIKPTTATGGQISFGNKKPSGLTERNYEKLQERKEISNTALNRINEKTETEFRNLTNKIIEESPISDVHKELTNDNSFKQTARDALKEVQKIADNLPKNFETREIKSGLSNLISKKKNEGLTPSEFDKSYNRFIKQFISQTPDKQFTASKIVTQYRKNNSQLSEVYEPGQSYAYNRAKREALLDYNRLLADMIENEFPNSEFSNLFKETNKRWADISNSEVISEFMDKLFEGKINHKQARVLFDKEGATVPFKRALGEKGFSDFTTLLDDLLKGEKGYKMLKIAEQKGYGDLAKTASAYVLDPGAAKAKGAFDLLKGGYKKMFDLLIDKPTVGITWKRGLNAFKRGDFKAAQKDLEIVKASEIAFDAKEKARIDSLKKFNKNKKSKQSHSKEAIEVKENPIYINSKEKIPEKIPEKIQQNKPKKSSVEAKRKNSIKQKNSNPIKEQKTSLPVDVNKSDISKRQRDVVKQIVELRKEKKSVKGPAIETRNKRDSIEIKINSLEKEFYKNKKSVLPDLIKKPRSDISKKGLNSQKDFIIRTVEDAIKNPPDTAMLTIDVPGDGVFKVWNIEDVLKDFMGRVKKKWPVKQLPKPRL